MLDVEKIWWLLTGVVLTSLIFSYLSNQYEKEYLIIYKSLINEEKEMIYEDLNNTYLIFSLDKSIIEKEGKYNIGGFKFFLKKDIREFCGKNKDVIGCTDENGIIYIKTGNPTYKIYKACIHEICHNFVDDLRVMSLLKISREKEQEIEEEFCEGIDNYGRFYICDELINKLKSYS